MYKMGIVVGFGLLNVKLIQNLLLSLGFLTNVTT